MTLTLTPDGLVEYVRQQLNHLFPDRRLTRRQLAPSAGRALERVERCFSAIVMKYYREDSRVLFNHLHTNQYAAFLYFLSHALYRRDGDPSIAAKVYALNKALHGLDVFYEVELPDIFLFEHPVGTVLGRATYGDYLVVYQQCTVGANFGVYPVLGAGVVLYAGSAIIGRCRVGDNSWIAAGARVIDADVPVDTIAFGQSPHLVLKPATRQVQRDIFHVESGAQRQVQEATV